MKTYYKYILIFIFGAGCVFFTRSCSSPEFPNSSTQNKTLVKSEKKLQVEIAFAKKEEVKSDTAQKKAVRKYREVKKEIKTLPCDTALKKIIIVCDTLHSKDSVEIGNLRHVIALKDSLLFIKSAIHKNDSMAIQDTVKYYKRRGRRQFFNGFKLGFGAGNITGAAGASAVLR